VSIAQALRESRKARGLKQGELGLPYSESMVSMVERGERPLAADIAPMLAAKLDHPAIIAELARELTGFGPAWLDGDAVDLHRASVREKCLEELREAMEAINDIGAYIPPGTENDRRHKERYAHLLQVFDAIQACFVYCGVQSLDYGFSMLQLSKDHHLKLKARHYVAT